MERTFRMAWGKGAYYSLTIGVIVELVMIFTFIKFGLLYLGIGLLIFCMLLIWLQYSAIRNNRYEITESDLIARCFGDKKRIYPIDKIHKIVFVDCGTDWQKTPPNCRYQLAIFFDRKYIKSVEPRRFGPEDRNAFVDALLEINPQIIVDKEEKGVDDVF